MTKTGSVYVEMEGSMADGEQHTHEETQSDEHVNQDGSRVETEKTEKVEVETNGDE